MINYNIFWQWLYNINYLLFKMKIKTLIINKLINLNVLQKKKKKKKINK